MLPFYKPTKRSTGSLVNFSFSSKGDKKGIFVEFVKQTSWDDKAGVASFKGGEKVNIKLSLVETAGILRAIEGNTSASLNGKGFYHKSDSGSASISFSPYMREGEQVGFSFSVMKQESGEQKKFAIGLDFNESTLLREFLKFALEHVFSGLYSDVVKAAKERSNSNT